MRWSAPNLLAGGLGIAPRVEYQFSRGSFTSDPFTATQYDLSGTDIPAKDQFSVSSTRHDLDLLLPACITISNSFSIEAGLWYSIDIAQNISAAESILSPANAQFREGGRSRAFASGDSISAAHSYFGVDLGIATRFPITASLSLEPSVHIRADLLSIADIGSKAFSAGVSFSIAPLTAPTFSPPQDTVHSNAITSFQLEGGIHFTKNGVRVAKGSAIDVAGFNIFNRQYTELWPEIYFEKGSFDLRHCKTLSESEVSTFTPADLTHKELSEFGAQAINIIAYRLKKSEDASIVLHASYTDESRDIAQLRLDALEKYFSHLWNISPDKLSKKDLPSDAHYGCYITSSDPDILAPVATQWIERSYQIPHIGLEKEIVATAGLKSWTIDITQSDHLLTHFSGNDPNDESSITDFDLGSDSNIQSSPAPLIASLHIEDFRGQQLTVSDTLAIPSVEASIHSVTERERFHFVFLPDQTSSIHDLLLDKCLSSIKNDAQITIANPDAATLTNGFGSYTIAESIVSKLKSKSDLSSEVHIVHRSDTSTDSIDPYSKAVIVTIDQAK